MYKLKVISALVMVMMFVITSCSEQEVLQNISTSEKQLPHIEERTSNTSKIANDLSNESKLPDCFDITVSGGCNVTISLNEECAPSSAGGDWKVVFEILDENFNIIKQQAFWETSPIQTPYSHTFSMNQCGAFQAGGYVESSAGTVWGFDYDGMTIPYVIFRGRQFCLCSASPDPGGPNIPIDPR